MLANIHRHTKACSVNTAMPDTGLMAMPCLVGDVLCSKVNLHQQAALMICRLVHAACNESVQRNKTHL